MNVITANGRNGIVYVFIKDVGSSNGTFVNGVRLSPENMASDPRMQHDGDEREFGVDIMDETETKG